MLNREEDIRRRLTIAEVPKPPADLVQKIKHEIPKHFVSRTAKEAEKRPTREVSPLWNFWGFSWQLAASILVLIGLTWAVFEAYRSEVQTATAVADASKAPKSVEEVEELATEPPAGTIRVEGAAPVVASDPSDELKKRQEAPAAPSPYPTVAQAATPTAYAPEPQFAEREKGDTELDDTAGEERAPIAEDARAPSEIAGNVAAAETRGRDVAPATPAPPKEEDASPARAAKQPAAPALAMASTDSAGQKAKDAEKEVFVKDLTTERVVTVKLLLDPTGKVVEATVVDVRDKAILDAVLTQAKTWTFATEKNNDGSVRLTRTIDVLLKDRN